MSKIKTAIGIDIGASSVKMVHLSVQGEKVSVLDYKIREYPESVRGINIPSEVKVRLVSEILKNLVTSLPKYLSKNELAVPLILSADGSQVFIRVFKLPGVARSKLAKIVAYEAQQQVPFPIHEVVWSYQCLRRVSPEETDVVLCAARTKSVQDFMDSMDMKVTDIIPPIIGLNTFINSPVNKGIKDQSGQAVVVLDLGAKTTNVVIHEKDTLWFRTIPIGGDAITQAIAADCGVGFVDAEILKREKGEIVMDEDASVESAMKQLSTCIIKSITRLTGEIARSIEVYSSSFNSLGPREIWITGGASALKNVDEFIKKKFRVEVKKIQCSTDLSFSNGLEGPKDISKINTAIGLALYGLGLSKVKLSLLPHSIAQKYLWMKRKAYIAASAGLAIFLFVCASVYNVSISRIYNAKMKEMTGEQKTLDFNQQQLVKAQNELNAVKEKMNVCGGLLDARNSWLNMLLDLEIFMPDNMWLTGLSIKGPEEKGKDKKRNILNAVVHQKKTISLRMSGKTTGTYQDIVSLKESLNRSPYFVKDTGIVVSANPPTEGVREFIFDVEAQMVNEYDEE